MNKLLLALTLSLGFLAPELASAQPQPGRPRVDQRQAQQKKRVVAGVESGALTKKETVQLAKGQAHVRRVERRAEADGQVTAREKVRMEKAQDRQSRRIYRQKHDGQRR